MNIIKKNTRIAMSAPVAEVFLTVSCSNSDEPKKLKATPPSASLQKKKENNTMTVVLNKNWTSASRADWCTVAPVAGSENGSITLTATTNDSATKNTSITIIGTSVATPIRCVMQIEKTASSNPFMGGERTKGVVKKIYAICFYRK